MTSFFAICAATLAMTAGGVLAEMVVPRNGVFETVLKSTSAYENPSADVEVTVRLTSPSGATTTVYAFWDGADVWRVRLCPTEVGEWKWRTECSDKGNRGLHARSGSFDCTSYQGANRLQTHGPLKLSLDRRYLAHADGSPFFWLADTAWNGVLKARPQDWDKYLAVRKSQGFTAVQFVSTPWRSFDRDSHGESALTGAGDIRINPAFFQRLDAKVAAINEHGLVASPVILWAVGKDDLGQKLSETDAIRLSRYIVARWGAYNVVWMLGGDGDYAGDRADRWRRIGRAVFGDKPLRPVTMHPCGQSWIADEFHAEPWYSFIGYQSGHGDSDSAIRWLVQGPPATQWDKSPVLPVINLEPNYETHIAYDSKRPFDAHAVRTALYRSLLVSPTAGVTYGHHGIWFWTDKAEVPTAHPKSGIALPWDQAMKSEGAESAKHLKKLFSAMKWWTLRPDPSLVAAQPLSLSDFIASARNDDGTLAVFHLPKGGAIEVNASGLKRGSIVRWFDPVTGRYAPAGKLTADRHRFDCPFSRDCILIIGR